MLRTRRGMPALLSTVVLLGVLTTPPISLAVTERPLLASNDWVAGITIAPFSNSDWKELLASKGALGSYHRPDGALVVVVPASGSSSFRATDALDYGVSVDIETADIELSEIAEIKELAGQVDWQPREGQLGPMALFVPRLGVVKIWSDAPVSAFGSIVEKYPKKVLLVGRGLALTSRQDDIEPHYGGAQMAHEGSIQMSCTSGFSVKNAAGNNRMVTAAHCFDLNETVDSPFGSSFGTVKRRDNFPTNDFELVGGSGIGQAPQIYLTSTSTAENPYDGVVGTDDPNFALTYCFSGARTFVNCGLDLIEDDAMLCYNQACTVGTTHVMVLDGAPGKGSCKGDSGAPVYYYYQGTIGPIIVGIVIAGDPYDDDEFAACQAYAETVIIEKWSKIRDTYDVTIKTV